MGFNLPSMNDPKKKTGGGFAASLKQAISQPKQNVAPAWTRPAANIPVNPAVQAGWERQKEALQQTLQPTQPKPNTSKGLPTVLQPGAGLMPDARYARPVAMSSLRAAQGGFNVSGVPINAPSFFNYNADMMTGEGRAAYAPLDVMQATASPFFQRQWWEPTTLTPGDYDMFGRKIPAGYTYFPGGRGFVSLASLPPAAAGDANGNSLGGGGWNWGGGGGGGGYSQGLRDWVNNMLNWNINRPDKGG